jgi:CheY-like chemotaxis protein
MSSSAMAGAPRTILVVDDDEEILLIASTYLIDMGYVVLQAMNGNDGLRILAERHDIDLLFTDIVMPGGIDGFELARRAVEKRPALRVLYTSGYIGKPSEAKLQHGRLLPKPWRAELLRVELERAFE